MTDKRWESVKSYEDILYEKMDGIARVTINRPEKRNAFRPRTVTEMIDAFSNAREDPRIGMLLGYEPGRPFELYERARDPGETVNTYADDDPRLPRLRAWIDDFVATHSDDRPKAVLDRDHLRALEALGYVELVD